MTIVDVLTFMFLDILFIQKDNESVNSVLIGGDLGQETLVKGRMKLDLVLYFKGISY